jgi:hypothetical protein
MKRIILFIIILLSIISCKDIKDNTNDLIIKYDTKTEILKIDDKTIDFSTKDINKIINSMGEYDKVEFRNGRISDDYVSKIYTFEIIISDEAINLLIDFKKKGEMYYKHINKYNKTNFYLDDIMIANNSSISYLKRELNKRKIIYSVLDRRALTIKNELIYIDFVFTNDGSRITDLDIVFAL